MIFDPIPEPKLKKKPKYESTLTIDDFEKKTPKPTESDTVSGFGFSANIKVTECLGNGLYRYQGKIYREIKI